jgi:sugar diacid utilization regulator
MAARDTRILDWQQRFRKSPLARDAVLVLAGRAPEIWQRTFDLLRKESPEYRNAVDDEFTAESKGHCGELLQTIVAIAGGRLRSTDPFAFVRKHAEWRARHQVPLVASLRAYRLAHKTYWGITRPALTEHPRQRDALRALAMLSEFWMELFEAVGAILEETHAAEEALIFAQNTRAHAELIDDLLNGTEPAGAEARRLLTLCGIRAGMNVTVALVRQFAAADGKQVDVEVATRSMARLLNQVLPSSIFGKLVGVRNGETVVIAGSGADTSVLLAKYLARQGFGKRGAAQGGAAVGMGLNKAGITHLPEALAEARAALDLAKPNRPMLRFSEVDLAEYLIRRADGTALRLVPAWLHEAHANGRDRDLLRTIRAFADCSLNVKETANRLGVHPNTVYFRLNQIQSRTGVDPRTFEGTALLVNSLRLLERKQTVIA